MGPGIEAGRVVEEPTGTVDLAPTVLDLQGVEVPAHMDARSLKPVLLGGEPESRPVTSSLTTGDRFFSTVLRRLGGRTYKLMCCRGVCPEGARPQPGVDVPAGNVMVKKLFDLSRDPGELSDVSSEHPDLVAQMAEMLPDVFRGCRALDDEARAAYAARIGAEHDRTMEEVADFFKARGKSMPRSTPAQ
uniref:Uncharacterized protein n=2 Tax=Alexandrium monilatum TaxID=311494 RepID=A0A7S4VBY6_9DINO